MPSFELVWRNGAWAEPSPQSRLGLKLRSALAAGTAELLWQATRPNLRTDMTRAESAISVIAAVSGGSDALAGRLGRPEHESNY